MLRHDAKLLHHGADLSGQVGQLFLRASPGLDEPGIHQLLVIVLGLGHGLIGHALHLLVALHRDPDLTLALHVLDVDAALAVKKTVKRCRCHRCLLHKKIPIVMMGMMLHVRGG